MVNLKTRPRVCAVKYTIVNTVIHPKVVNALLKRHMKSAISTK